MSTSLQITPFQWIFEKKKKKSSEEHCAERDNRKKNGQMKMVCGKKKYDRQVKAAKKMPPIDRSKVKSEPGT